MLIDANLELIEAKNQYESELDKAKELHPNDEKIDEIEKSIKDLFKANKWIDSESYENDFCNDEDIQMCASQEEQARLDTVDRVKKSELPPDHDDYLDLIAWLKSPEGILEIERDYEMIEREYDNKQCPSFSLGISQLCKELMEEHGSDADGNKDDGKRTDPLPQKQMEKRTKREIKVGPAFRSPYLQRNIDVNSSYTRQEIAVYRWMILDNMNDM